MLLKVLYFILLVVAFRFVARLVRALLAPGRPPARNRSRSGESPLDGEIIDVEFTEDPAEPEAKDDP